MNKLTIAKALRTSFNAKQKELLDSTYMGDDYCLNRVREMQDEYREFKVLTADMRENDEESYNKLLGL